ncbi:unannotated protein [freshwater metagenome]|uniref:Unannotated protein n=1 Tax=freshwater metagenome TaxID=449393 RepID=A0A6J7QB31_9ZZZZ
MHVACAIRRDDHHGRCGGAERPELGHRDRVVGEDLEQERLELVVGAVDLVDQQHRRRAAQILHGAQQRAPHQEAFGVEVALDLVDLDVLGLARGLDGPKVQQLLAVVPLVNGLCDVDALVALQADQLAARPCREHLGHFGLADTGFTFEQQRPPQPQRQEDHRGESEVG